MTHATGNLPVSKPQKVRSWSFVAVDGGEYLGTLTVRQGPKADVYDVEENAVHPAPVREFILRKQSDGVTFYAVLVAPAGSKCTCPGHGYTGHCKHVDAITEALADGVLEAAELESVRAGYHEWLERTANTEGPIDQPEPAVCVLCKLPLNGADALAHPECTNAELDLIEADRRLSHPDA